MHASTGDVAEATSLDTERGEVAHYWPELLPGGKAVLYTAFLISAGIILWSFSPLRFQAEMGYQLLIILTMNMLGGLFLLPALITILRPRFILGNVVVKSHAGPS